ncbi:cellulase [Pseudomonas sp. Choline-3u-10]|jgi:endoglucanase|uniref:glycoside hydrolase family 5 protein n=1 Tax=Pseudomonadaceae TaxID=135621 RepID=UPI000617C8AA|nr:MULTISPECIES: glycoside hydrolase family 5 protein [Pseudomonadaceae]MAL35890.1 cellulase [Pseudomonas sp.]MBU0950774.1 glycoside hydrolase family 5 protein [Gammaproteobacteria bacterium]KJJ65209.1 cellulase [Pseudomonas sp. 10B238]MBK3795563.1 cellulase family glycosylhydrolase [Stutzerimonas stutzeri]MBK3878082.1 cellulase family glycosylhydrolase [Stutzerimonas stutzeri]
MPVMALATLLGFFPVGGAYAASGVDTSVSSLSYSALVNKFTNSYWQNGSWRASAGVSVAATQQNMTAFRVGTSVRTADGQIRTVTALKPASGALTVFMNGPVLDGNLVGYPNRLRVSTVASTLPVPASPSPAPVVSPSHAALINKFTNSYWLNGSWRASAGVSVAATAQNKAAFVVGASVRTADGQVRTITSVKPASGALTVFMDGPVLDGNRIGYPNKLSLVAAPLILPAAPSAPIAEVTLPAIEPVRLVGVALSGAAFGPSVLPGKHGTNYIYPAESYYKKYAEQGLKLVRLPFLWERIQPKLDTELDTAQLALLTQSLDFAHKHGVKVVLDMHNYYRYYRQPIGSETVSIQSFANTWKRIALKVGKHPALSGYGLMNEPNTKGLWPQAALAAAKEIRKVDRTNWIYVAGDRFSSAWHWPQSNTQLIADPWMRDPNNNLIFEAHMYLDRDTSGMYVDKTETFAPELGINRAKPFVDWLRTNNLRGFIGEMGVPNYAPDAILAMDNLLGYLRENCVPLTYWAGGPWWGNYILALDVAGGAEQPQLAVLRKHAATPNSCAAIGEPL